MGSTLDERAKALEVSYAAQGGVVPQSASWLRGELEHHERDLDAFRIMVRPVTQQDFLVYVRTMGAPEPYVDEETWTRSGIGHPYRLAGRFLWKQGEPREDRLRHPVVLVSHREAQRYCAWWGDRHGGIGALPTEPQWEKAARGEDARWYPWGDRFDSVRLNALESGAADTMPVGVFPESESPYGIQGMAGNVFEWTNTVQARGIVVKGGGWGSDGSAARAAARHVRPAASRHPMVGFRCTLSEPENRKERRQRRRARRRAKRAGHGAISPAVVAAPDDGLPPPEVDEATASDSEGAATRDGATEPRAETPPTSPPAEDIAPAAEASSTDGAEQSEAEALEGHPVDEASVPDEGHDGMAPQAEDLDPRRDLGVDPPSEPSAAPGEPGSGLGGETPSSDVAPESGGHEIDEDAGH